jgi:dihydrodipicolinate synthase/N-acetylneuraminate lyase
MNLQDITFAELRLSPLAVPPVARNPDLSLNRANNAALVRYLEQGGIRFLMYGGNANLYQARVSEFEALLTMLAELAGPETWVIPSIGPDFGKILDQAPIVRRMNFPTAMVLPYVGPMTRRGLLDGLRRTSDLLGKPFVLYIKNDDYLAPDEVARLIDEGRIRAIKYAAVHADPSDDRYLRSLLGEVSPQFLISGIGERPAIVHLQEFGLNSFTTGSGCVAPRASLEILRAIQREDWARARELRESFMPLEDLRDATSPIQILHDAVSAAVADMGPAMPYLANANETEMPAIRAAATALKNVNDSLLAAV